MIPPLKIPYLDLFWAFWVFPVFFGAWFLWVSVIDSVYFCEFSWYFISGSLNFSFEPVCKKELRLPSLRTRTTNCSRGAMLWPGKRQKHVQMCEAMQKRERRKVHTNSSFLDCNIDTFFGRKVKCSVKRYLTQSIHVLLNQSLDTLFLSFFKGLLGNSIFLKIANGWGVGRILSFE